MFLRFTLVEVDLDSKKKKGILSAAHDLRDEGALSQVERDELASILKWFNTELKVPDELAEPGTERAIPWFKASAEKPIAKMWQLANLLRGHGFDVDLLKSLNPGKIIYKDDWQVVAFPPRGKGCRGSVID